MCNNAVTVVDPAKPPKGFIKTADMLINVRERRHKIYEHLYNKGETLNFVRDGIILADFGSTRRFVDLLRWTQ